MAISTMYPAMPGSPETDLVADITADATTLTVTDGNVLPAAPNICVLGDESDAEVVIYNAKSGNVLSGLIRGSGGTTASPWSAGTSVARNYTSFDHNRFIENINDLETNKISEVNWGDIGGTLSGQTDLQDALDAKQDALTFDSAPTSGSTNPVTSGGVYSAFAKEIMYFPSQAVSTATSAQIMRIPAQGTSDQITENTVVLQCDFASPKNITSAVTWTSSAGYVTFSGTCTAATTANVVLGTKGN